MSDSRKDLARGDYAREEHEASKHLERNPGAYPPPRNSWERYKEEYELYEK